MFFYSSEKFVNWTGAIPEYRSRKCFICNQIVKFLSKAKPTQLKQPLQSVHYKIMKLHCVNHCDPYPMVKKINRKLYLMQTFLKNKHLNKKKCLLNTLKKFEQVTKM